MIFCCTSYLHVCRVPSELYSTLLAMVVSRRVQACLTVLHAPSVWIVQRSVCGGACSPLRFALLCLSAVPAPKSKAGPVPAPEPKAGPVPAPEAKAGPIPAPEPKAGPVPAPAPKVGPVPAPEPKAGPAPAPAREPRAGPVPAPQPEAGPMPAPQPEAGPMPGPQPQLAPGPEAVPAPAPGPAAQPGPAPAPEPSAMQSLQTTLQVTGGTGTSTPRRALWTWRANVLLNRSKFRVLASQRGQSRQLPAYHAAD